jgi:hypothetical protein
VPSNSAVRRICRALNVQHCLDNCFPLIDIFIAKVFLRICVQSYQGVHRGIAHTVGVGRLFSKQLGIQSTALAGSEPSIFMWRISYSGTNVVRSSHWCLVDIIGLGYSRASQPLWSSGQVPGYSPEVPVRFPVLPDFLRSSGSSTGSTQPREYNWGATWKKK